MSALKWWISLAVVLCIALPASLAFAQAAGLAAVGAPDPVHGFPKWYMDKNGLQLAPCLDAGAADPCGLIAAGALPNPAGPVVFPTNFPNEVFYNRATARISMTMGPANASAVRRRSTRRKLSMPIRSMPRKSTSNGRPASRARAGPGSAPRRWANACPPRAASTRRRDGSAGGRRRAAAWTPATSARNRRS